MNVRAATPADAAALAELRYEFRSGRSTPTESREDFVPRCRDFMAQALALGPWRAWVAETDAGIVGQIWMNVIQKLPNPGAERERHGYVSNLFVRPESRGGVGTRLLESVLQFAADERIDRIVLWATPESRTLYARYGFTRDGEVFERVCP